MRRPSQELFDLRQGIEHGHMQTIDAAHQLGLLNVVMFDIVRLFNFRTAGMLNRAKSFNANFLQRDTNENTLLHVLATSTVHVVYTTSELNVTASCDYYHWAIEVLVGQGLRLDAKNKEGVTPLDLSAKNEGFEKGLKLFEAHLKREKEEREAPITCCIL